MSHTECGSEERSATVEAEAAPRGALRGVIFDLDGTLGNTLPLAVAAFRRAIEPLSGRSLSDAEIFATFGPSEEGTIRALIPEHYDAGIAAYLHHYEALHEGWPEPFPGILVLLDRLKARGVRLALVTGKGRTSAMLSLKQFGLEAAFEQIEVGSPSGPRKAEAIRDVLAMWQLEPSEVVYVGDAPSDVVASREAGVAVVGAAWAETTDRDLLAAQHPDALLTTTDELDAWLNERLETKETTCST